MPTLKVGTEAAARIRRTLWLRKASPWFAAQLLAASLLSLPWIISPTLPEDLSSISPSFSVDALLSGGLFKTQSQLDPSFLEGITGYLISAPLRSLGLSSWSTAIVLHIGCTWLLLAVVFALVTGFTKASKPAALIVAVLVGGTLLGQQTIIYLPRLASAVGFGLLLLIYLSLFAPEAKQTPLRQRQRRINLWSLVVGLILIAPALYANPANASLVILSIPIFVGWQRAVRGSWPTLGQWIWMLAICLGALAIWLPVLSVTEVQTAVSSMNQVATYSGIFPTTSFFDLIQGRGAWWERDYLPWTGALDDPLRIVARMLPVSIVISGLLLSLWSQLRKSRSDEQKRKIATVSLIGVMCLVISTYWMSHAPQNSADTESLILGDFRNAGYPSLLVGFLFKTVENSSTITLVHAIIYAGSVGLLVLQIRKLMLQWALSMVYQMMLVVLACSPLLLSWVTELSPISIGLSIGLLWLASIIQFGSRPNALATVLLGATSVGLVLQQFMNFVVVLPVALSVFLMRKPRGVGKRNLMASVIFLTGLFCSAFWAINMWIRSANELPGAIRDTLNLIVGSSRAVRSMFIQSGPTCEPILVTLNGVSPWQLSGSVGNSLAATCPDTYLWLRSDSLTFLSVASQRPIELIRDIWDWSTAIFLNTPNYWGNESANDTHVGLLSVVALVVLIIAGSVTANCLLQTRPRFSLNLALLSTISLVATVAYLICVFWTDILNARLALSPVLILVPVAAVLFLAESGRPRPSNVGTVEMPLDQADEGASLKSGSDLRHINALYWGASASLLFMATLSFPTAVLGGGYRFLFAFREPWGKFGPILLIVSAIAIGACAKVIHESIQIKFGRAKFSGRPWWLISMFAIVTLLLCTWLPVFNQTNVLPESQGRRTTQAWVSSIAAAADTTRNRTLRESRVQSVEGVCFAMSGRLFEDIQAARWFFAFSANIPHYYASPLQNPAYDQIGMRVGDCSTQKNHSKGMMVICMEDAPTMLSLEAENCDYLIGRPPLPNGNEYA